MKNKFKNYITFLVLTIILSCTLFHSTAFAADGITLYAMNIPNQPYIGLQWVSQIQNPEDYQYRIFQKSQYRTSFQTIPTMYSKQVKVLWVYMFYNKTYSDGIEQFPANYGIQDSLDIDTVYYSDYNKAPASYLKDASGKYKYDLIFFGTYDMCTISYFDLSSTAKDETAKFLDAGHGAIFTHDTIVKEHPNYAELAKKYGHVDAQSTYVSYALDCIGGKTISLTDLQGVLVNYPVKLPNTLTISLTHTSGQILSSDDLVWAKFSGSITFGSKNLLTTNSNFFLATYNNVAVLQMGHSFLSLTNDEQSILINLFFSMAQLTNSSVFVDPSGLDIDTVAPTKLSVSLQDNTLLLSASDNIGSGTNYQYYVEAVNQKTGEKIQSNTVSITTRSGVAGYIITYDEVQGITPAYGTPPTVPAVPSTTINVPKNRGKYANITAVDYAGNFSKTESIYLMSDVDPLNLTSSSTNNGLNLSWTNPDNSEEQKYTVYKNSSSGNLQALGANFGNPIKILHVYPDNAQKNQMIDLVNTYGPKDNNNNRLITVDAVRLKEFNKEPNKYLRSNGQFIYDEIIFGFEDYNGDKNEKGDLSDSAKDEIEKFLNTGRGVLLGHETILGDKHPNFKYFAEKYLGMSPLSSYNSKAIGGTYVSVVNEGTIYEYPYSISGNKILIPRTHSTSQMLGTKGTAWFRFSAPTNYGNNKLITDNSANFYLATNNNIGMLQTGHTDNKTTPDEAKILINTLFYLSQLIKGTSYYDTHVVDKVAPSTPIVTINGNTAAIEGEDYGTTYEYYVQSISQKTSNKIPSNIITAEYASGIKEYRIIEDNNQYSTPSVSSRIIPAGKPSYTLNGNYSYLHVIAIDYAGNQSSVAHIRLK